MAAFQYLSRTEVEHELSLLMRGWTPAQEDRDSFVNWAWLVASASDAFARENHAACAELLREETAALERVNTVRARHVGRVSEELQRKRAFLSYLERTVEAARQRAATG